MKNHLTINISKVILNLMSVVLSFFSVCSLFDILSGKFTQNILSTFIICLIYLLIILDLRKIIYSTNLTPFCSSNVKRFKNIGYKIFLMAIIDGVTNLHVKSYFTFLGSENASLKASFFMYLLLACVAFVLAEIFEKAVEIKNENDLTV
ncbi:hypothetical protein CLOBY_35980 [Clostridium saccharobutylicum]|uniref:DUF2975 domain-containing protein n=1 Tax=Clostridium saccharobutylicum TaxID=169679 RepID=UPI0009839827|nr:DUF2975 domain-containing protein [Clostridium saccharobutylicum]AQS11442.1 hypothetical protein CLOBY_35980 [Clostridium saccharobutylicum]MBC2435155.1 DUF2975 domain-containing protein [Clostridium saccharobutylicum]NSB88632.1 hypothetical protein [Clostridium saccharobutylicum]NYC30575.1 hypothetical protein [Clostridium saccharobutylicum]OOM14765.1 hypothetical protein CLSAB_31740 [Clostridium saccharobutylicum]